MELDEKLYFCWCRQLQNDQKPGKRAKRLILEEPNDGQWSRKVGGEKSYKWENEEIGMSSHVKNGAN